MLPWGTPLTIGSGSETAKPIRLYTIIKLLTIRFVVEL